MEATRCRRGKGLWWQVPRPVHPGQLHFAKLVREIVPLKHIRERRGHALVVQKGVRLGRSVTAGQKSTPSVEFSTSRSARRNCTRAELEAKIQSVSLDANTLPLHEMRGEPVRDPGAKSFRELGFQRDENCFRNRKVEIGRFLSQVKDMR